MRPSGDGPTRARSTPQVQAEQQEIDESYAAGETDIANAGRRGRARGRRPSGSKAERDAENESWWDRAVSFVKDAFNALVSAIGDIFDAVRDGGERRPRRGQGLRPRA